MAFGETIRAVRRRIKIWLLCEIAALSMKAWLISL